MYLRKLALKDAPLMIAWMHDKNVTKYLLADFSSKTIENAEEFIKESLEDKLNLHLAIANDNDEYMGTVSLKHIQEGSAEFGITVRREAMGRSFSWYGMETILKKAFNELGLEYVYWCVSKKNTRAIRFYEKHNFQETNNIPQRIRSQYEDVENLKWYSVQKRDIKVNYGNIAGCRVINLKTIPSDNNGQLSFFEGTHEIPFEIKRIYYISKVPEGGHRGFHAHKKLKQFIFCPYGRVQLVLENKSGREEIELSDSSKGVLIEGCTWREMIWLQKDSVLCVAASDYYKAEDYIRNYQDFVKFVGG